MWLLISSIAFQKLFFVLLKLQGTPVNIIVGSHVWVEDTDVAWIDGQVEKINGQDVEVQATNGKKASSTLNQTELNIFLVPVLIYLTFYLYIQV